MHCVYGCACLMSVGTLMHSHDYRSAEPFADTSVVLLGAGLSGLDIAMELSDVNAKVLNFFLSAPYYGMRQ